MTIQELEQLIATYGTDIYMAIRIWKNRNRKMFRRNRIAPMKSTEETHVETAVPGTADTSEVEEGLLRREEIRQVQEILRRLPDKYRILLCMYYGEKLSVEKIAGCLRIPQGTVNSSPSAEVQRNLHRRIAEKAQAEIPAKRRFSRKCSSLYVDWRCC